MLTNCSYLERCPKERITFFLNFTSELREFSIFIDSWKIFQPPLSFLDLKNPFFFFHFCYCCFKNNHDRMNNAFYVG